MLWCLVIDDILHGLNGVRILTIGYADDINISSSKFGSIVSEVMQRALNVEEKLCSEIGLSVSPEKTALVAFTRKKTCEICL